MQQPVLSPTRAGTRRRSAGIVTLTLATAAIHLAVASDHGRMAGLFVLNGLGYLGLLGLLTLPAFQDSRWTTRRVLIGYATVTFLAFFFWGVLSGAWRPLGFADKVIEAALVVLLVLDDRSAPPEERPRRRRSEARS